MQEFKLEGIEFIPLCDLLKKTGLCESGGHAKAVIADGEVLVDNKVELRKRFKVRESSLIEFSGQKIKVLA